MKCYAIWEVDNKRIPMFYGKKGKSTVAFPSADAAESALNRIARRYPRNTRGYVYEVPSIGSAFDFPPIRTIAL